VGNRNPREPRRRSRYFQVVSVLLFAFVLAGFGRTFFLRPMFPVPGISWYIFLHGAVQVSWFVLLLVQVHLIAAGRTTQHRRLGLLGAVLATMVVGGSFVTVLHLPAHFKLGHLSNEASLDLPSILAVFWNDLISLIVAAVFIGTALVLRRHAEAHKRLMLFASLLLVAPALPRLALLLGRWISLLASPQVGVLLTVLTIALLLPLTIVLHDLKTRHRVHIATLMGVGGMLLTGFAGGALSASTLGQTVFLALE
jgi:hypothetical protein